MYRLDPDILYDNYSISFQEHWSSDYWNMTVMFPEPGKYRVFIEMYYPYYTDSWGNAKDWMWGKDKYIDITVQELPISNINIAYDSLELKPGENVKLAVTYLPAHATYPEISYSSNANNIAYVDSQGNIFGVNPGNAMVFANSVRSNASDNCWIHVHNIVSYDGKEATATESGGEAYEACNLYNACAGGLCEYTTYQEIPALGCNVSGTITSAGSSTDSVTVELYGQDATTPSYSTTVTGNNASYSLVGVASGTYTMKVSKAYHMTQEVTVIVDDANVTKDVDLVLGVGEVEFKIESASLAINQDINITYKTYVPESFSDAYMVFRFMGKDYIVDDYTIDTSGRYCYIFRGVNPQYMGENIHATLYATVNGVQVSVEIPTYSIRQYCVNRLEKTTDPEFKALLSDLLLYGEKAQIYVGYNTDNLVTEGITLSASTFTTLDSSYSKFSQTGIESDEVRYSAAALVMSNNIFLRLSITTLVYNF